MAHPSRDPYGPRVNAGLRHYVKRCGVAQPEVTQRLKRSDTIVHKLVRHPGMALTRMEDIGGVRVVLPTQQHAIDVATLLQNAQRWTLRRERFYIDGPIQARRTMGIAPSI